MAEAQQPIIIMMPQQAQQPQQGKGFPYIGIAALAGAGIVGYAAWKGGYIDKLLVYLGLKEEDYTSDGTECVQYGAGWVWDSDEGKCVLLNDEGCTSDADCGAGMECNEATGGCKTIGTIPGIPRQVAFNVSSPTSAGTNRLNWSYGGATLAMMQTIAGSYTLVENHPNAYCKASAKVSVYAVLENGTEVLVMEAIGRFAGTYSFIATVQLLRVKSFYMIISGHGLPKNWACFGMSDNDIQLSNMQGATTVII